MKRTVTMTLNGASVEAIVEPRKLLSDALRDDLQATGTHVGCEHGVCGACTVLLDGVQARSCLMLAVQADGRSVVTIEGLSEGRELSLLQRAMRDVLAFQCGFCTPGFLICATELLATLDDPSEDEIREFLAGNICRCTGYQSIIEGVRLAMRRRDDARILDD